MIDMRWLDVFHRAVQATCVEVRLRLWKEPWTRLYLACLPVEEAQRQGVKPAIYIVDDETVLPTGAELVTGEPVPLNVDDAQRDRWILDTLRRAPIIPEDLADITVR